MNGTPMRAKTPEEQAMDAARTLKTLMDQEARIAELECELAHAYWDSCGCLAGGGHAKDGPECPSNPSSEPQP